MSIDKYHVDKLVKIIVGGLLDCPELLNELPSILISLENGKEISLNKIKSEKGKEIIEDLFNIIPLLTNDEENDLKQIRK